MTESPDAGQLSASSTLTTPGWVRLVRVLLLVAAAGAAYLAWVSFQNGPVAGCGTESGCNKVLQSRWAYWLDIPVSVPALAVYLGLFGFTFLLQRSRTADDQRGSWAAIITLSIILAGAALWFIGLQVFVIKAFCKFCMTAHACGLLAALLCLKSIPFAKDPETPMWSSGSDKWGVPRSGFALLAVLGLAGLSVLAGGQLLVQKERNLVKVVDPGAPGTNKSIGVPVTTNSAARPAYALSLPEVTPNLRKIAPGLVSLYSNQFQIKLEAVPMMGPPGASNIIVCLFDYTCPHCRALHPILAQTQSQYSNLLGIVCLPMPISTNCNRHLPSRIHSVPDACEYAQLGLAVWRANPAAFRQFDDWMFTGARPQSLEKAREIASQLVGGDKLNAALSDPWVNEQIQTDCDIHLANWNVIDTPIMPQIIMGHAISAGPLNSVEHLEVLLNQHLGLPMPLNNRR